MNAEMHGRVASAETSWPEVDAVTVPQLLCGVVTETGQQLRRPDEIREEQRHHAVVGHDGRYGSTDV